MNDASFRLSNSYIQIVLFVRNYLSGNFQKIHVCSWNNLKLIILHQIHSIEIYGERYKNKVDLSFLLRSLASNHKTESDSNSPFSSLLNRLQTKK